MSIDRYGYQKKLKACPFCGGIGYIEDSHRAFINAQTTRVAFIRCKTCNARTSRFELKANGGCRNAVIKAMEAWNRRTDEI